MTNKDGNGGVGRAKSQHKKRVMIESFRQTGNVLLSAHATGIARRTHYRWLEADDKYKRDFNEATEDACDLLEAEATRRAIKGVNEPVYQGGELVGTITKYSDVLLMFLLNGRRPNVFRNRVEHLGEVHVEHDVVLTVEFDDRSALPKQVQNLLDRGGAPNGS